MKFSVVVPVYGCPSAVKPLCERLIAVLETMSPDFEIILVNDACPKGSWAEIEKACDKDRRVIGLDLAKNRGQSRAITAGLDRSSGEWVIVMDCDLQDRPEHIPMLYRKASEGYDVVASKRGERKDSAVTKFFSRLFYKIYNYFADDCYDPDVNNFCIMNRKVVDALVALRENKRDFAVLLRWVGFRQTALVLEGDARFEGKSAYTFRRKLALGLEMIMSQSNKPLYFSIGLGLTISGLAFLFVLYLVLLTLISGSPQEGWTSMIAMVALLGGLQLTAIGIVGIYIGNIFDEVKRRPLYTVMKEKNTKQNTEKQENG